MNSINEKYGVVEYNNSDFINKVNYICDCIFKNQYNNQTVIAEISNYLIFNRISINMNLTWLKYLDVYYIDFNDELYNEIFDSYGITPNRYYGQLKSYLEINEKNINNKNVQYYERGTVFLLFDKNKSKQFYQKVLFHEIVHLFNNIKLKEKHLLNNDLVEFFSNQEDILKIEKLEKEDIVNITLFDAFNIIRYCMYYMNLSESHVFMENINFEILHCLSNKVTLINNLRYLHIPINQQNIFRYSSSTLQIYFWLNELLIEMLKLPDDFKINFNKIYNIKLKEIYGKTTSFNNIILKYLNIIKHIKEKSSNIFNDYCNLFINFKHINENSNFRYFGYKEPHKRFFMPLLK